MMANLILDYHFWQGRLDRLRFRWFSTHYELTFDKNIMKIYLWNYQECSLFGRDPHHHHCHLNHPMGQESVVSTRSSSIHLLLVLCILWVSQFCLSVCARGWQNHWGIRRQCQTKASRNLLELIWNWNKNEGSWCLVGLLFYLLFLLFLPLSSYSIRASDLVFSHRASPHTSAPMFESPHVLLWMDLCFAMIPWSTMPLLFLKQQRLPTSNHLFCPGANRGRR